MTHETVTVLEHEAGDALRHYAPVVQQEGQEGGEALKRTALVLGAGLLMAVVASATALTSLAGAFEGRAEGRSR
jgi:hypothetical protein